MPYPSIFHQPTHAVMLERLDKLTPSTKAVWGSMNPAQILAHINVSYQYTFGQRTDTPPFLMRLLLKIFLRS